MKSNHLVCVLMSLVTIPFVITDLRGQQKPGQTIKVEEARKSLIQLAKQQPKLFFENAEEIEKAPTVVDPGGFIKIGRFAITLDSNAYTYRVLESPNEVHYLSGNFVWENGDWKAETPRLVIGFKSKPKKK